MIIGGGQEKGIRCTENVLAIAGLGLAAELMTKDIAVKIYKNQKLARNFRAKIKRIS